MNTVEIPTSCKLERMPSIIAVLLFVTSAQSALPSRWQEEKSVYFTRKSQAGAQFYIERSTEQKSTTPFSWPLKLSPAYRLEDTQSRSQLKKFVLQQIATEILSDYKARWSTSAEAFGLNEDNKVPQYIYSMQDFLGPQCMVPIKRFFLNFLNAQSTYGY